MTNKNFTFLPNGTPVLSLKNQAKKLVKSKQCKSQSFALNQLSKELFNKPFNKIKNGLEQKSPFIDNNVLYVPLVFNLNRWSADGEFIYYVAITNDKIIAGYDFEIQFGQFLLNFDINTLSLKSFEKIDCVNNGWFISLSENIHASIKVTDEGFECSLFECSLFEHEQDCFESLCSTYLFDNEILELTSDYNAIKDRSLSINEACFKLDLTDNTDHSDFLTIGSVHFNIYASLKILIDNEEYSIYQIKDLLKDHNQSFNDFICFVNGSYIEYFEKNNWEIIQNPYFCLESESGDLIGEVFDTLPKTLNEKSLFFIQSIINR